VTQQRTIHLDTSFLIHALGHATEEAAQLAEWMRVGRRFSISAMAWAELMCGPLDPEEEAFARALLPEPAPLGALDAELGADLFNATGRRRGSLNDCLIAATAIRVGASLATCNVDDFERFVPHGLELALSQRP
jgi:predicted nucleic acid-binding protein